MQSPGSILLIACYELGHQPLGIASPLGFLQRAGYAAGAIDLSVEALDPSKVSAAAIVGISVPMHTALRLGVRAAARIREINPTCHICFFGLYAGLNVRYLLEHVADSVIAGEYETALVELVEALSQGRPVEVQGVSTRGNWWGPILKPLPFEVPSRGGLPPLRAYAHLEQDHSRRLVGCVEASRGCLHHCLHCPIPPVYDGRFFIVPRSVVLEDIRKLVEIGATHITFGDPDFLNGPGHSLAIVRAMRAEFPEISFDFTAKVEHILKRRSLFPEFASLGCLFVVSAVESLSDTVLAYLEKGHTRADVFAALAIPREAGIALRLSLLSFTPWTTLDDYIDVLEFVEREGLIDHVDPVQYTIRLLIPPGSALLSRPAIKPFLGRFLQESFTYQWNHPDPRMDLLQQAVTATVERAARSDEDPAVTFFKVKRLAVQARGNALPVEASLPLSPKRHRPPRLTESWFC